jgi:hypothetical protein
MECRRAERLLRSASSSSAASAQTYELTLARAYLEKAREEASEAHYGPAIELANASQRASQRARAPFSAPVPDGALRRPSGASESVSGVDGARGRD